MADRDPDTIKQEIDQAREQLASTVDSLAAGPIPSTRRGCQGTGDQLRQEAGRDGIPGRHRALTVVLVVRRIRNR
ncbi:hypothetical protein I553_7496 [Mycobacterium xenopi 4042]|uniref:DUF3618 domain-containing protein n=1 Tax=Mycobacterium xenopi 4042 TaxID=1299334 RepID=X8APW8_MYCXE|nr:hypothetical protein I553_7496 [Mycobacterium xenopi 4042]